MDMRTIILILTVNFVEDYDSTPYDNSWRLVKIIPFFRSQSRRPKITREIPRTRRSEGFVREEGLESLHHL